MVKEKGWYYVAITGDAAFDDTYLPLKRSRDLVHWEELGPALTELPAWVLEALGVTPETRRATPGRPTSAGPAPSGGCTTRSRSSAPTTP